MEAASSARRKHYHGRLRPPLVWGGYLVLGIFLTLMSPAVGAASVDVYDGPLYVDPASSSALQSILQLKGHTVTTFTGTPPASTNDPPDSLFVNIDSQEFASTDVIVFPFSNSLLDDRLTPDSLTLLRDSVLVQGKGLITVGNGGIALLNRIFFPNPPPSFASTGTGGASTLTTEADGTPFENGPTQLIQPANSAINPFAFTPPGHLSLYRDSGGVGGTTVFTVPSGDGQYGFLGWNFAPGQDADWNSVLDTMVSEFGVPVPVPAAAWLLLSAVAVHAACLKRVRRPRLLVA